MCVGDQTAKAYMHACVFTHFFLFCSRRTSIDVHKGLSTLFEHVNEGLSILC